MLTYVLNADRLAPDAARPAKRLRCKPTRTLLVAARRPRAPAAPDRKPRGSAIIPETAREPSPLAHIARRALGTSAPRRAAFCLSQLAEDLLERLDDFVAEDAAARKTSFRLNCLVGGLNANTTCFGRPAFGLAAASRSC